MLSLNAAELQFQQGQPATTSTRLVVSLLGVKHPVSQHQIFFSFEKNEIFLLVNFTIQKNKKKQKNVLMVMQIVYFRI
jgi:hypothetical protein